jgi:hypothetical protein
MLSPSLVRLESVQAHRVPAQHTLADSFSLGEVKFSLCHQPSECLAQHAPSIYGADPV